MWINSDGYVMVATGKKRATQVMEEYLGRELLPGEEVHHKNRIKIDDQIENLEVLTKSDHMRIHASRQNNYRREKLTIDQVKEIRQSELDDKLLSLKMNVSRLTISRVKRKATWKWVES
jgi:hypothetical protein